MNKILTTLNIISILLLAAVVGSGLIIGEPITDLAIPTIVLVALIAATLASLRGRQR